MLYIYINTVALQISVGGGGEMGGLLFHHRGEGVRGVEEVLRFPVSVH